MKATTLLSNVINQIDLNPTVNHLIKEAHKGDTYAQAVLGISFLHGDYDRIDEETAVKWIEDFLKEKGPSSKWPIFSEAVGICYYEGIGKKSNNKKSFEHLEQAAILKRPIAMHYLADFFMEGIGTKKDMKKAFHWYKAASTKIKDESLIPLKIGYLLYNGLGVKKDVALAKKFYEKSAKLGNDDATFNLILLANAQSKMTPKIKKMAETLIENDYRLKAKLKKILKENL
jgi:TPR repeat protein